LELRSRGKNSVQNIGSQNSIDPYHADQRNNTTEPGLAGEGAGKQCKRVARRSNKIYSVPLISALMT